MKRRPLLKTLAALPLPSWLPLSRSAAADVLPARWVRPGEPGWPSPAEWAALGESVGGRLVQVQSAFAACGPDAGGAACTNLFQDLLDPFYIDQSVNLTQTLGWVDAFTSQPSAYAVLAASSADVAAAVNFAREHFQGLTQAQAEQTWAPFFDWVKARPADYKLTGPAIGAAPAQDVWNAAFFKKYAPTAIVPDPLPGAPDYYYHNPGNAGEVAAYWSAYQSTWLSQELLAPERQPDLVNALVQGSQFGQVQLHCNKGLAGGAADAVGWTADTSMNPAVLDAFALAIAGNGQQAVYPGIPGHEPDIAQGRQQAELVTASMAPLKALRGRPASYFNETDYFEADWQTAFWGEHYSRLLRVKERYDPGGLFFVHHGVGTGT